MEYGFLSLIPPLLTIVLALVTKNVFLSQSGIYKAIGAKYGCTVSEYISHRRVERSLPLLEESEVDVTSPYES